MSDKIETDDIRMYAHQIVVRRLLLRVHAIAYALINLMLFFLNNLGEGFSFKNYQWWPWIATGWGLALLFHVFIYIKKGNLTPLKIHTFMFFMIAAYMVFVDYYSTLSIDWSWIPILCWGGALAFHFIAKRDSEKHTIEVTVYGLFISDESGRILIDVVLDENTLRKKMNLGEEGVEMVGMFVNAMQSFSTQLKLADSNEQEFNVNGKYVKMHSIKHGTLTLTAIVSPTTKDKHIKPILKQVLRNFSKKYAKKITIFQKTGNCNLFVDYKSAIKRELLNMGSIVAW